LRQQLVIKAKGELMNVAQDWADLSL